MGRRNGRGGTAGPPLRPPPGRRRSSAPQAAHATTEAPLREWLISEGGAFHPSLVLVDAAPSGCRGVVASAALPLSELEAFGPLLVVPAHLHLENGLALAQLQRWMGRDAADAAAAALSSAVLVAMALAHEAALGATSRWAPYTALLSPAPPSPWLLPRRELRHAAAEALAGAPRGSCGDAQASGSGSGSSGGGDGGGGSGSGSSGGGVAAWVSAAEAYRAEVDAEVARALELLAGAAAAADAAAVAGQGGGWLSRELLTWAIGHVESRSLGTSGSSGLVPAVDLLNHDPSTRPPMLQLDDSDRLVVTVLPMRDGDAAPLAAADELCIDYGARAPLEGWLKFGFVSAEWWRDDGGGELR
ncbi:hypothetical protein Rsub_11666 [Raphidocelis subcapitata]|uniref:SET domain-containing protein n=1 Tax=Raphidocelis subcapitata TaxID=307507 RepID=A0A2V0PI13_9CHLO|nr:hypothetical protein Rsub_11666 [Raphidocelis subcapitata]|eukprot:GBF98672.1 hypothetical protein Rsub_11666 [Raphidocelis subcapitata]